MVEKLRKLGIERNFLNLIDNIYKNPTTNTTLKGKRLNIFLSRSGERQGCPLSSPPFHIVLEIITNIIKQ